MPEILEHNFQPTPESLHGDGARADLSCRQKITGLYYKSQQPAQDYTNVEVHRNIDKIFIYHLTGMLLYDLRQDLSDLLLSLISTRSSLRDTVVE